ncbi:MAG: hypothetical protein ABR599_12255 [Gemmatimonadota bacterium]
MGTIPFSFPSSTDAPEMSGRSLALATLAAAAAFLLLSPLGARLRRPTLERTAALRDRLGRAVEQLPQDLREERQRLETRYREALHDWPGRLPLESSERPSPRTTPGAART